MHRKYAKANYKDGDRMDCKEIREMYKLMFAEYPDIVTVKDLQTMLGISRHAAYDLLGRGRNQLHPAGKRLQNPQNQCDQLCSEKSVRSDPRERVGATLILARAPPRLK
ncbi:excisionase [human gut metagenome]|uniref:Excisionase n=1 Tax=human gut metagenome TaxID=408170 RepID=K1UAX7_9ZZZZ